MRPVEQPQKLDGLFLIRDILNPQKRDCLTSAHEPQAIE